MGEVLEIRTRLAQLGKASGIVRHEIMLKGTDKIIADADITFVMVNTRTNKAVPIEGEIRQMFERLAELTE